MIKKRIFNDLNELAIICASPVNESKEVNKDLPDERSFQTAKDCGFNIVMYPGSEVHTQWREYMSEALRICKKLDLKLICNSPILSYVRPYDERPEGAKEWPQSLVREFDSHEALCGWQFFDEPLFYNWNEPFQYYEKDAKGNNILIKCKNILSAYQNVKGANPQKPVFMNQAFSYDDKWIGNHSSYLNYLDYYIQTFRTPFLSYDYYPVYCNYDSDGNDIQLDVNLQTFYAALETFSLNYSGKSFLAYCLCYRHKTGGRNYPFPTTEMMRFEAFNALAYGAQGIVFWYYRLKSQLNSSLPIGVNNSNGMLKTNAVYSEPILTGPQTAPIGVMGEKSDIWYRVQSVISEIKQYNYIFYNCNLLQTSRNRGNGEEWIGPYGSVQSIKAMGRGVIISHIHNNGRKFVVIVSSDPFESQEIRIKYINNSYVDVGIATGPQTSIPDFPATPDSGVSKTLAAGGYYIIL